MKQNFKTIMMMFAVVVSTLTTVSCSDDPEAPAEAYMTGFKITNAGPNQDLEVVASSVTPGDNGVLEVPFGTDVTALNVQMAISEGASVIPGNDTEVDFTLPVTFVVTNGSLSNTYTFAVEVQEAVALEVTAHSSYSGDNAPTDLTDNNSRSAGSDSQYLYVPDKGVPTVYAIALTDIANGSVDMASAKTLSTEGMDFSGTSFKISDVKTSGGAIYACAMGGEDGQWVNSTNFKVWKWDNADADPVAVIDWVIDFTRPGMDGYIRLGDSFTVDVDENGNGSIYVVNSNGAVKDEYYEFEIAANAQVGEPVVRDQIYAASAKLGSYAYVYPAATGELLASGAEGMFLLAENGDILVNVPTDAITTRARAGQVFEHEGNRYLAYLVYNEGANLEYFIQILDITGGSLESAIAGITAETVESKIVYTSENFHGATKDGNSSGAMSISSNGAGFDITIFNAKNGFVYFQL